MGVEGYMFDGLAGCRALASNMVTGVSEGWTKQLQLIGVGYRGTINGSTLVLNLGFSHPVEMEIPEGIQVKVRPFYTDVLYLCNVHIVHGSDGQKERSCMSHLKK